MPEKYRFPIAGQWMSFRGLENSQNHIPNFFICRFVPSGWGDGMRMREQKDREEKELRT